MFVQINMVDKAYTTQSTAFVHPELNGVKSEAPNMQIWNILIILFCDMKGSKSHPVTILPPKREWLLTFSRYNHNCVNIFKHLLIFMIKDMKKSIEFLQTHFSSALNILLPITQFNSGSGTADLCVKK